MNTKYWNLSLTLIISFIVFVFFTLIQSTVLLLLKPENLEFTPTGYENLAYSNLGIISSISSLFGVVAILFFIYFKKVSIIDYLNLYMPKLKTTILFISFAKLCPFHVWLMCYLSKSLSVLCVFVCVCLCMYMSVSVCLCRLYVFICI